MNNFIGKPKLVKPGDVIEFSITIPPCDKCQKNTCIWIDFDEIKEEFLNPPKGKVFGIWCQSCKFFKGIQNENRVECYMDLVKYKFVEKDK